MSKNGTRNGQQPISIDRKKNGRKADGTFNGIPGPGRPPGVPNKLTKDRVLAAIEAFAPINEGLLRLAKRHVDMHERAQEVAGQLATMSVTKKQRDELMTLFMTISGAILNWDCATCRHLVSLSSEYTYGKPTQHHTVADVDELVALMRKNGSMSPEQLDFIQKRAKEYAGGMTG